MAVRTFFQLDGDFAENWFSSDVTDYIPRPFVDWWCDNFPFSGEINFQMGDESKAAEPEVLAALRDGACLNEDVLLRPAGYQGRGPQPELDLQWPNGTVTGVWVTLAGSPDEAGSAPETGFALTEDSYEAVVFRTPDFGEECAQDDDDCLPWYQVQLGWRACMHACGAGGGGGGVAERCAAACALLHAPPLPHAPHLSYFPAPPAGPAGHAGGQGDPAVHRGGRRRQGLSAPQPMLQPAAPLDSAPPCSGG